MTAKQSAFRDEYRKRVEPWYNGLVHVSVIYALGIAGLWVFVSRLAAPITAMQLSVIPLVFVLSNIAEWSTHKYVMHRPRANSIARAIYIRHTRMHHQFFTQTNYSVERVGDFRIVFFPPYTQLAALGLAAPGSALLGAILGRNAGWLAMSTVVSLYMTYETFHFCCHVNDNWFVRTMPFVNTIRRHHIAHHDHAIMMDYNMNLTFPIADWLFGTSDLKRGLLGTLLNGYSTAYVRSDMVKKRVAPEPLLCHVPRSARRTSPVTRYSGERTIDGNIVMRDGQGLDLRCVSHDHSETDIDWGFDGPASRRLAFAILLDHLGDAPRARALTDPACLSLVSTFDNRWVIDSDQLDDALVAIEEQRKHRRARSP